MIKIHFLLLLISALAFSQVRNPWEKFISSPNERNFRECEAQIKKSIPKVSESDSTITLIQVSDNEYNFLRVVATGNPYAMELCFQLYKIFPPGYAADREHFNGVLGMSATRNPMAFLKLLCKYARLDPFYDGTHYADIHVSFLILGVSDNLLDRLEKQRLEFTHRLSAIETVTDTTCSAIRQKCVEELKEKIKQLNEEKE